MPCRASRSTRGPCRCEGMGSIGGRCGCGAKQLICALTGSPCVCLWPMLHRGNCTCFCDGKGDARCCAAIGCDSSAAEWRPAARRISPIKSNAAACFCSAALHANSSDEGRRRCCKDIDASFVLASAEFKADLRAASSSVRSATFVAFCSMLPTASEEADRPPSRRKRRSPPLRILSHTHTSNKTRLLVCGLTVCA